MNGLALQVGIPLLMRGLSCLAEQNLFYIFNWLRTSWCDPHPGIYRSFSGVLSDGVVYKDCNLSPNNSHSVVLDVVVYS